MRLRVLLLAVLNFVLVAGLTVHLQVRASLRSYQLGREHEELRWLQHQVGEVRARVEARYAPARVFQRAEDLRGIRGGDARLPEI